MALVLVKSIDQWRQASLWFQTKCKCKISLEAGLTECGNTRSNGQGPTRDAPRNAALLWCPPELPLPSSIRLPSNLCAGLGWPAYSALLSFCQVLIPHSLPRG